MTFSVTATWLQQDGYKASWYMYALFHIPVISYVKNVSPKKHSEEFPNPGEF